MVAFPQQILGVQATCFKNDSEDLPSGLTIMLWDWVQLGRLTCSIKTSFPRQMDMAYCLHQVLPFCQGSWELPTVAKRSLFKVKFS